MVPSICTCRRSLIRIVEADGAVVLERPIATTREGFDAGVRRTRRRCGCCWRAARRVSGWRSSSRRCGHEVIVADPNYALMYGRARSGGSRPIDGMWRRWPRRAGWGSIGAAHRVSAAQRAVRRRAAGARAAGARADAGDQSAARAAAPGRVSAGRRGARRLRWRGDARSTCRRRSRRSRCRCSTC